MTNNSKRVSYYVMLAKNVTKELFSMLALLFKNTNRLSRKSNLIWAAKLTGRYNSYRKISLVRVSQRLCISIRPLKKLKSNVYWASLIKRLKRWKSSLVQNFWNKAIRGFADLDWTIWWLWIRYFFRKLRRIDYYFLCRLRIFQQWVDSQFEMKVKRLLWGLSRRSSNKLEPFQSVTFSWWARVKTQNDLNTIIHSNDH